MNAVSIAIEVIRKQPAIKPLAWTSGIIIDLNPDEWLDITDPSFTRGKIAASEARVAACGGV